MKRTLAILIAMLMVLSCVPVSAITLETAEAVVPEVVAEETVDLASELDVTNDEDLYNEELGQLILYYDYDGETDPDLHTYADMSYIDSIVSSRLQPDTGTEYPTVVADPADESNNVILVTTSTLRWHNNDVNFSDLNGVYTIVFDSYAESGSRNMPHSSWRLYDGSYGGTMVGGNGGATVTLSVNGSEWLRDSVVSPLTMVAVDGGYKAICKGVEVTSANHISDFVFYHYGMTEPFYLDNFKVYYKPLTATFVIGGEEVEYELDGGVSTVLPVSPEDVADYTGDFYGWKIGELVYTPGASVNNYDLMGKTVEIQATEIKNEVTYRVGNTTKVVDMGEAASIVIPAAADVNAGVWTDTDTVWLMDGVLYEAGDEVQTAAIRNKTFTAVDAENEAGKLILYYDFDAADATNATFAYKNADYVGTTGKFAPSSGASAATEVVADPAAGVTGNNVLKINAHDTMLTATNTFTRNGTYTVKYDGYASKALTLSHSSWRTAGGSTMIGTNGSAATVITTAADTWTSNTATSISVAKTSDGYYFEQPNAVTGTSTTGLAGLVWYGYNAIPNVVSEFYFDNVAFYYAPLTATFANGETTVTVELGEEANFKMPAASTLNIGYTGEHYGWLVGESTAYAVGANVPVKDLFGKTLTVLEEPLANEATFSFFGKTATVDLGEGENYTFVAPSTINAEWKETFSKWYFDGVFYNVGDTIAKSAIIGKTVEHVVFDSAEHGTLAYYITYENSDYHATSKPYVYINSSYVGNGGGYYPYLNGVVSTIDNPYGEGKVGKITADTDGYIRIGSAFQKDYGTYTIVADGYVEEASSFSHTFWQIGSTGNDRTYNAYSMNTAGAWDEYVLPSITYAKKSDGTFAFFTCDKHYNGTRRPGDFYFYNTSGACTYILDNIKIYYKPLELTYVNGDEKVAVKPGEVTSITLPEYSAVDADWVGSFAAWNINGTNYQPGATVAIDVVLGYDIIAVKNEYYVNYRGEVKAVEGTNDATWVLPQANDIDASWGATAYTIGNKVYMPGDEVAAADLLGNTVIAIDAVKFDETKGELVLYFGFEEDDAKRWIPTYYNTEYIVDPDNFYINYGSSHADFTTTGTIVADGDNTVMTIERTGTKGDGFSYLQANYYDGAFATGYRPLGYVAATGRVKPIDVDAGTIADTYGVQAFGFNNNDQFKVVMDTSDWEYGVWQEFGGTASGGVGMFSAYGVQMKNAEEGKSLSYSVDDIAVYMFPAHKLYFMAEQGAEVAYSVEAETSAIMDGDKQTGVEVGTVIVPTPADLGMDVDAQCWMSASGTVLNFGAEVTPTEFASEVYYPAQVSAPVTDETIGYNTVLDGIRFKASVSAVNAAVLEEYGFLVARKTILGDAELTFEFTTEEAVTKAYITAVAYDKSEGIEELLSIDEDGATEYAIACYGFEDNQKDEEIVARPYAKYFVSQNEVTIYGTAVSSTYNNAVAGAGALTAVAPTVQG